MKKVSFQGEHGAYSDSAARKFFNEEVETVPCNSFEDTLFMLILIHKFSFSKV